jgi:hypothetical protein
MGFNLDIGGLIAVLFCITSVILSGLIIKNTSKLLENEKDMVLKQEYWKMQSHAGFSLAMAIVALSLLVTGVFVTGLNESGENIYLIKNEISISAYGIVAIVYGISAGCNIDMAITAGYEYNERDATQEDNKSTIEEIKNLSVPLSVISSALAGYFIVTSIYGLKGGENASIKIK